MRSLLFPALLLAAVSTAQYNGPESVEYDPAGDRYFVSNTQTSRIKVRAQDGTVTDFVMGMPNAPYGLEIMGNVLYACTGNGVRGYDLTSGAEVYYRNLGALFPNGITTDGTYLYITDFSNNARRIYKVDPIGDTHSTLVDNLPGQPNGAAYNAATSELLVAFWGSNAAVRSYDPITGANLGNVSTGVGSIDGITIDCDGLVLISSWSPARISRFDWGIISPTFEDLNVPGLSNPADIDFDHTNLRICIPNSGNNTVTLFDYTCLSSGHAERGLPAAIRAFPNPVIDHVTLEPPFLQAERYTLRDVRGAIVLSGVLPAGGALELDALSPGAYLLQFSSTPNPIRLMKQ